MDDSIRVMVERGKKKRVVASAFDWPGWDRSAKTEDDALRVLADYRPRYVKMAALVGLGDEFGATGDLAVIQRLEGNGMTDYYGLSHGRRGRRPGPRRRRTAARRSCATAGRPRSS